MEAKQLSDPLLLAFATSHPDSFAALLANRDMSQLAQLAGQLPVATAAAIAARLPSWQLTTLLATLEPARVCDMLVTAPMDEAVALVSHLHVSRYNTLRAACPPGQRRILLSLLEFPSHSLAALATTDFIRVAADTTCAAFAEQLANSMDTRSKPVLVVDGQGRYRGLVALQSVFARRNRSRPVGDVALAVEPLNGLTDAATALTARVWARYPELPVVDHHHRLLGIVSREALERVTGEDFSLAFSLESVISELSVGYLNLCGRLLEAVLGRHK